MRVCVLTTSYPRWHGDVAGAFVSEIVEHLRAAGDEVTVVSPADVRHFGIAYGGGIAQNLRAKPWLVAVVPLFLLAFARAARRAAAGADLVHAHWLPTALPALATGKPFVVQLWGSDAAAVRRARVPVGPLLRRAACVIGASEFLAAQARELGARTVAVVPVGLDLPASVGRSATPPHVLYLGRLSEEKGIGDFLAASDGLERVIVGDGPLRAQVPEAHGFVAPGEVGGYLERAAVVCVPSHREGYGMTAREAMAYGRPVVATAVGGLADAVLHEQNGLLVTPGRPKELRAAIARLLGDPELRARLGANAREAAARDYAWPAATAALREVYARALARSA